MLDEMICTLHFRNDSPADGAVCVFQQDPTLGVNDAKPVAWLVKSAAPRTNVFFRWPVRYCFVWAHTGNLSPEVFVRSSQVWPTGTRARNEVLFTRSRYAYTFAPAEKEGEEGTLSIITDTHVEADQVLIGIGMADLPTFVVPARPDKVVTFHPQPSYWVAFGSFLPGEVLSADAVERARQLPFSPAVSSVQAVLRDEGWVIQAL